MLRLAVSLWIGGSTWPLLFGCLFASAEIYHLVLFGPCQRHHFMVGCGAGATSQTLRFYQKTLGRGLPHYAILPLLQTLKLDIFPLFFKFFWHLAFLLGHLLHIFLHLFHIMQPKQSHHSRCAEQKIATTTHSTAVRRKWRDLSCIF